MIHIVTAANRHLFENELLALRSMSGARAPVGAPVRSAPNHSDIDIDAIYILGVTRDRVYGGSCLAPSTEPHVLSDAPPHLASMRGALRGAAVYEWTLAPALTLGDDGDPVEIASLLCGLLEYCLAEGIYAVSTIIETALLPRFHDMGWSPRPLGLPERLGDDWVLAVLMPIDEVTLEATRAFYGIDEPAPVRRGLHPSVTREIGL